MDTLWEDPDRNLEILTNKIKNLDKSVDVIVLPELFSTGFTMNVESIAEPLQGKSVSWMLEQAHEKESLLIGSLLISVPALFAGGHIKYYNRLVVAFPDGKLKFYDKRHLFSFAGEEQVYTAGNKRLVFGYKGFKICPLICYDLRFPVWSRNNEDIDLLIYVANWPNARMHAWDILLKARAIENLCYVVGVNRVGIDNSNLVYDGHSNAFNAYGEALLDFEESQEAIKTIVLHKNHIIKTRIKFGFLDDGDEFEVNNLGVSL